MKTGANSWEGDNGGKTRWAGHARLCKVRASENLRYSCQLRCRDRAGGFVLMRDILDSRSGNICDQPRTALEGDIVPRPVRSHDRPIPEADQKVDVHDAPERPCNKPTNGRICKAEKSRRSETCSCARTRVIGDPPQAVLAQRPAMVSAAAIAMRPDPGAA